MSVDHHPTTRRRRPAPPSTPVQRAYRACARALQSLPEDTDRERVLHALMLLHTTVEPPEQLELRPEGTA